MSARPYYLRVMRAAMESHLPKDVRHLVHVMACLADSKTGVGRHGQQRIAEAMGCSQRHVRALLRELEQAEGAHVRVVRQARYRSEGRGRTSDEWRLVLADQPEQCAAGSGPTKAHSVPVEASTNRNDVPVEDGGHTGTPRTTNRKTTTDLPEQRAGHGSALESALGSAHKEGARSRTPLPPGQKKRSRLQVALEDERVQRVVQHYRDRFSPRPTWTPEAKHNGKVRALAVLDRLKDGHTVEDLQRAIDGLAASEWHRREGHTDLELAMRPDKVQRFIAQAASGSAPRGPAAPATPDDFADAPPAEEQLAAFGGHP